MINALSPLQIIYAVSVLIIAYMVRGIAGFGSGLIAIPLLTLILPLYITVPLIGLLDYLAALSHGVQNRQTIKWREILPLIPFSLLGVVSALYVFKTIDLMYLHTALGIFILIYATYTLLNYKPREGHSRAWAVLTGGLGGFIGTLFGTGGPFYVIYLQLRGLDKAAFRSTISVIFIFDGAWRIIGFFFAGMYAHLFDDARILLSLPIMAIALYAGEHIHTSLSPRTFQQAIAVLLVISGVVLLLK